MPGSVFLRGEVVTLRPMERDDVEFLTALVNDPTVRRSLAADRPIAQHDEREWIESANEDGGVHLLACADDEPVGTVGLNEPNETWGVTELGYMIDPDHWGHGYATDAADRLCAYAFEERRLNKVFAEVYETNPASTRVLEKVGFEREGVHRQEAFVDGEYVDIYRYGLLASEY